MMTYEQHIRLIAQETSLTKDHFYKYTGTDIEAVCDNIYRYVQEHLDFLGSKYGREPAKMFFYNADKGEGVNAYADVNDWIYLVGINDELLRLLRNKYLYNRRKFRVPLSLRKYQKLCSSIDLDLNCFCFNPKQSLFFIMNSDIFFRMKMVLHPRG